MKTPLSWISLYAPLTDLQKQHTITALAHEYSIHTAEIDGIEEHFLDKVVIGKVISCEKHPESKKLSIVEVDIGGGERTTILTGAANIVDATYVAVAVVGAVLPGDFTIGERMMAGMMSRGMICSDDELGLAAERAEGIMILENIWESQVLESMIGRSFFDLTLPFPGQDESIYAFPLRDTTFEIDNKFITNRPDLFSIVGNAREWHAVFGIPYSPYISDPKKITAKNEFPLSIETDRCLTYNALKMEGLSVAKTPLGMSVMMQRAGLAPKMDIVDITNLIMTELGQPMHAFDADKVHGGITVRQAKPGEKLLALNGTEYTLDPADMVIADDMGPIALAGIMGGMDSAVSETTTNVIWESGTFDPVTVRLSSQRHGLRTDASMRYEKSLDPLLAESALPRIYDYLQFLGKTINITGRASYLDQSRVNHREIDTNYEYIEKKIGIHIEPKKIDSILESLGFEIQSHNDTLHITVPSWRATKDIAIREDIAEEVGRVYGYDHVGLQPLDASFSISKKNREKTLQNQTLRFFADRGWHEVYNYSFTNTDLEAAILSPDMEAAISIQNAFNTEYTHMRRSLAPRLFENIRDNIRHASALRFFEIGKVYSKIGEYYGITGELLATQDSHPFFEKKLIAGVSTGYTIESVRADIENYLSHILGYVPPISQGDGATLTFVHPGISGRYHLDEVSIVRFGRVHPSTVETFEIPSDTIYWEIEQRELLERSSDAETIFEPISRYQAIDRELNFIMNTTTPTSEAAETINATHPWIHDVSVDSIYEDADRIGTGLKSVNFSFRLQSLDATISDEEALQIQNSVIDTMQQKGWNLRQ